MVSSFAPNSDDERALVDGPEDKLYSVNMSNNFYAHIVNCVKNLNNRVLNLEEQNVLLREQNDTLREQMAQILERLG
jgi:hypothetical protein